MSSLPSVSVSAGHAPAGDRPLAAAGLAGAYAVAAKPLALKSPRTDAAQATVRAATVAPTPEALDKMVSAMQRKVTGISADLQFSIDKETGKTIVKLTDESTKELIWQFPSEEAMQITKALDQYQRGLLVNRKA